MTSVSECTQGPLGMPKKNPELQIKILKILDVREGKCGKSFNIKVVYHKSTWVHEKKLSPGVSEAYLNKLPIPKGVWTHMPRHYKVKPKLNNPMLHMIQQRTEGTPDCNGSDEDEDAPVKKKKKVTNTVYPPEDRGLVWVVTILHQGIKQGCGCRDVKVVKRDR